MINEDGRTIKTTFPRKGYGRIFVEKEEDIEIVKKIIKEMDSYEYEYYLPRDIIGVFNEKPSLTYTHKFTDIDLNELMVKCWNKGIKCFYVL